MEWRRSVAPRGGTYSPHFCLPAVGGGGDGRDAYDDETLPPPHGAIAATSNGVGIFCRSAPYTFQGTAAQQQYDAERSGRAERITSVLIAALLARPIRRLEAIYPGIPCDAP